MADNNEKYFEFALNHKENNKFLNFFRQSDVITYMRYLDLNKTEGTFEDFRANPLFFIICNQPQCCYKYAIEYIEKNIN